VCLSVFECKFFIVLYCIVLTAYRKSPAPYLTVTSPTPYDLLPFSYNSFVTDGRTTDDKRHPYLDR